MEVIDVTFGNGVVIPDRSVQFFVSSLGEKKPCQLNYDPSSQLLTIKQKGHSNVVIVGLSNIKHMTVVEKKRESSKA